MANTGSGDGEGTIPLGELLGENEMPRDALPAFPMARRGYSPPHVDAYVHDMIAALEEARSQLELAGRDAQAMWQRLAEIQEENDRHRAVPAFEGLGDHIDNLLTTAAEESDAIRARAEEDAAATLERAQQAAESSVQLATDRLAEADQRAAAVMAEAYSDAEAIRREATLAATKILARRDLGIAAIAELSRVLSVVAAEALPEEEVVVVDLDVELEDDVEVDVVVVAEAEAAEAQPDAGAPRPRVL
jgi:cell division septum initiation protein DivIVA